MENAWVNDIDGTEKLPPSNNCLKIRPYEIRKIIRKKKTIHSFTTFITFIIHFIAKSKNPSSLNSSTQHHQCNNIAKTSSAHIFITLTLTKTCRNKNIEILIITINQINWPVHHQQCCLNYNGLSLNSNITNDNIWKIPPPFSHIL